MKRIILVVDVETTTKTVVLEIVDILLANYNDNNIQMKIVTCGGDILYRI